MHFSDCWVYSYLDNVLQFFRLDSDDLLIDRRFEFLNGLDLENDLNVEFNNSPEEAIDDDVFENVLGDDISTDNEEERNDGVDDIEDDGDQRLYAGAPITLAESILSILTLSLTHNLTRSCLLDILTLISLHIPPNLFFKKTLYKFRK